MKRLSLISALILSVIFTNAQKTVNIYEQTDKNAGQIPESYTATAQELGSYIKTNFATESDRARAAYIWIANHIDYDIDNVYAINFYETDADRIKKVMATRKGVCAHYAVLYNEICRNAGLTSYIIEGFTRQGVSRDDIPHAWCAVQIDNTWYLTDPTWGAGYVSREKFYRKLNNDYFKVSPAVFLKTHMPFDYLWQFMENPISPQEFYEGKPGSKSEYFNYVDSIAVYERLDSIKQMEATVRRVEKNGLKNSMIFDRYQHLKLEVERLKQNRTVNLYNSAMGDFNTAVNDFNDYVNFYNKQFTPTKPDTELEEMLNKVDRSLSGAKSKLKDIDEPGENLQSLILQSNRSLNDLTIKLEEQQEWMKKYLAKGKMGRKSMFHKITWMGIPMNELIIKAT